MGVSGFVLDDEVEKICLRGGIEWIVTVVDRESNHRNALLLPIDVRRAVRKELPIVGRPVERDGDVAGGQQFLDARSLKVVCEGNQAAHSSRMENLEFEPSVEKRLQHFDLA